MITARKRVRLVVLALLVACLAAGLSGVVAQPARAACPSSVTTVTPVMVTGTGSHQALLTVPMSTLFPRTSANTSSTTCSPVYIDGFTSSAIAVNSGDTVSLNWRAHSAAGYTVYCNASSVFGGVSSGPDPSEPPGTTTGSWPNAGPIIANTDFGLHCWDDYGDSADQTITVSVIDPAPGSDAYQPQGWVDEIGYDSSYNAWGVRGWSCDWDVVNNQPPADQIYVDVSIDGATPTRVLANLDRPDVAAATWACNGHGDHGFWYPIPVVMLNGQNHTVDVKAVDKDSNGNVGGDVELNGSPQTAMFTSGDSTAPLVSFAAPANGSIILTRPQTLTVNASDNVGVTSVQYRVDGVFVGSSTVPPYAVSWDPMTVSDANHTLSATAYDAAGNHAVTTETVSVDSGAGVGGDTSQQYETDIGQSGTGLGGYCAAKNQRWIVRNGHFSYHSWTGQKLWGADAQLYICVDYVHRTIMGFTGGSVTPEPEGFPQKYEWSYNNNPLWVYGLTGGKIHTTSAQVTFSYTYCTWGIGLGCYTVTAVGKLEMYTTASGYLISYWDISYTH